MSSNTESTDEAQGPEAGVDCGSARQRQTLLVFERKPPSTVETVSTNATLKLTICTRLTIQAMWTFKRLFKSAPRMAAEHAHCRRLFVQPLTLRTIVIMQRVSCASRSSLTFVLHTLQNFHLLPKCSQSRAAEATKTTRHARYWCLLYCSFKLN